MRLLVSYLLEYQNDYETDRSYISAQSIEEHQQLNDTA